MDQGLLGAPVLTNAIAALECTLDQYQAVGTHGVFIGRIVATSDDGDPLVNCQGALRTLPPY
jgi:flavin reductase (DIM6/NTAB) family NADH-FMN oxidoreductase RutF